MKTKSVKIFIYVLSLIFILVSCNNTTSPVRDPESTSSISSEADSLKSDILSESSPSESSDKESYIDSVTDNGFESKTKVTASPTKTTKSPTEASATPTLTPTPQSALDRPTAKPPKTYRKGGEDGWVMVFNDEFEGETLNTEKWEYFSIGTRHGISTYNDNNALLDGKGNLLIRASYIEHLDRFITGGIRSREAYDLTYGYFEISVILPKIEGFLGAFWLMPRGGFTCGAPNSRGSEIDIFETPFFREDAILGKTPVLNGIAGGITHGMHWGGYGIGNQNLVEPVFKPNLYDGNYHTFAVKWNENYYTFYINDVETWKTDARGTGPSKVDSYMLVSACIHSWSGDIRNSMHRLPGDMIVDYVRVYQKP